MSLRVENLVKQFNGEFGLEIPRLEFHPGKIYGVIGPNGAGKTTLLNLLSLLEEPSSGGIFFKEQKVAKLNSLNVRRKLTMIMENPLLFHSSVYKNIISGLKHRAVDKKTWPQLAADALKMVGMEGFEKRYAPNLSGGETQRVAIARALVLKPEILFLDEPFTNIDQRNITLLEDLIKGINQKYQTTIIFTTHDLWQAHHLADEVISLVGGRMVDGSLDNLFTGEVEDVNGLRVVRISPQISVTLVTNMKGKIHICIPPQDIILSYKQVESSARNSFLGRIVKIQMQAQTVRLHISVDAGVEFIALITKASYEKMSPAIDSEIFLTFKSTSVKVF